MPLNLSTAAHAQANPCAFNGSVWVCSGDLTNGLTVQDQVPINAENIVVQNYLSPNADGGIIWNIPQEASGPVELLIEPGTGSFSAPTPVLVTSPGRPLTLGVNATLSPRASANVAGQGVVTVAANSGTTDLILEGQFTSLRSATFPGVFLSTATGNANLTVAGDGLRISTIGTGSPGLDVRSETGQGQNSGAFTFTSGTQSVAAPLNISTAGAGSPGIEFASEGGAGTETNGNGGGAGTVGSTDIVATIATGGDDSPGLAFSSIGGLATQAGNGNAGAGGNTFLTGDYTITTEGRNSQGIAVSSAGGFVFSGNGAGAAGGSTQIQFSQNSSIVTRGDYSEGLSTQTIGGRGGAGGTSRGLLTFAADGGSGGAGGGVTYINEGAITTFGNGSTGLLAQTIGGGGGDGGSAFGLFYSEAGSGARGGAGGQVDFENRGSVTTSGNSAPGISIQSIGGTGGSGGSARGLIALGGRAASASPGGQVVVVNSGTIETGVGSSTPGDTTEIPCAEGCSYGIVAQSIGGGGGNGGFSGGWFSIGGGAGGGGAGGDVTVANNGLVSTGQIQSHAILAQSIGGGGGNGGASVAAGPAAALSIGGSGGSGGNGGEVLVTLGTGAAATTAGDGSHAVQAQSIGGGGGNGNFAIAASAGLNFPAVSVAVGGSGGSAGSGAPVRVTSDQGSTVTTEGDDSLGILAQSIGGGGGNGAFAASLAGGNTGTLSLAVGGGGGNAGGGGTVLLNNQANVTTSGDRSGAVTAQSIGGGGGNGGLAVSAAVGVNSPVNIGIGVGGAGARGGGSSGVNLFNDGNVSTAGEDAPGLRAQAIGGGGGNGGMSIGAQISVQSNVNLGASVGGFSGEGGAGSTAVVTNRSTIDTSGDRSQGILAQSIGGGGGSGGTAVNASLTYGGSAGLAGSVGGGGAGGGNGNTVTVENSAAITTGGDMSGAIVAQSIGGGGGSGGASYSGAVAANSSVVANASVGGFGAAGGASGAVTVGTNADLSTNGALSDGILAQSIAGGGGNGGTSIAGNITSGDGTNPTQVAVSVGGGAGRASSAGAVNVDPLSLPVIRDAAITVTGEGSRGIVAQSIGGSGGIGGLAIAGNFTKAEKAKDISVAVGGSGGPGGSGSSVLVRHSGALTTGVNGRDYVSGEHGILAQSIGGGGGDAGVALTGTNNSGSTSLGVAVGTNGGSGNTAGAVTIDKSGTIQTYGAASHGILAQSIGGGGGNGAATERVASSDEGAPKGLNVSVGGSGGSGNNGGTVGITNTADIATTTAGSKGILAQSIGGGGGTGGTNQIRNTGDENSNVDSLAVVVGGGGGTGGSGNRIDVVNSGTIVTGPSGGSSSLVDGAAGYGIAAQSIGGGGGSGGIGLSGDTDLSANARLSVGIGGGGSAGGNGNDVNVTHEASGAITTREDGAHGIFAQSVGGGGGDGGAGVSGDLENGESNGIIFGVGGTSASGQQSASSGVVRVTSAGAITTGGDGAKGIFAQSVGGGGGAGGVGIQGNLDSDLDDSSQAHVAVNLGGDGGVGGNADLVEVNVTGQITTGTLAAAAPSGSGRMDGVFAQSVSGGGGNGSFAVGGETRVAGDARVLALRVGGAGAAGGNSSNVIVRTSGQGISAQGDGARGIVAQSIGGGGGDAQSGFSGDVIASGTSSSRFATNVEIGGNGGAGGSGGRVTVINSAPIQVDDIVSTNATGLHGILAQSVGGGGGTGGVSFADGLFDQTLAQQFDMSVGATSGGGGNAVSGNLTALENAGVGVRNDNSIQTTGSGSIGIFAQSVGGGGGAGEAELDGGDATGDAADIDLVLGTQGGDGGNGGTVWVENLQSVITADTLTPEQSWTGSHAILAQSIGGGGGNAEVAGPAAFSSIVGNGQGVDATLGAFAGGGDGNGVIVTNGVAGGTIPAVNGAATFANASHGIVAQSIGGGGGVATAFNGIGFESTTEAWTGTVQLGASGGAGGNASSVQVTQGAGQVVTTGEGSVGILAQSIGGGGGEAGQAGVQDALFSYRLGAANGVAGSGGAVTVNMTGSSQARADVETTRRAAAGIVAQSIGAGGGLAGTGAQGSAGSVTLGGSGGASGAGDTVLLRLSAADLLTKGNLAPGIIAQSIGGGGGASGRALFSSPDTFGSVLNFGAGSQTTGSGGQVGINLANTTITTEGDHSPGLVLQSVGGGGGIAGTAGPTNSPALVGSAGGTGQGGRVNVLMGADGTRISTKGTQSHGLIAQSAGGAGTSTQPGQAVLVEVFGDISATGAGSHGVFTQSVGDGRGPILLNVAVATASITGGTVSGGAGGPRGAAVFVKDGATATTAPNQIFNEGTIQSVDGADGVAVLAEGTGRTIIWNSGTIVGQTLLGAASEIRNDPTGVIQASVLDAGGVVNEGIIDVGAGDSVGNTIVVGSYLQSPSGIMEFDLDPGADTNVGSQTAVGVVEDQLIIEGEGDLAGMVEIDLLDPFQTDPGQKIVPLILAEESLSFDGTPSTKPEGEIISELEVTQSAVAQYQLIQSGSNEISLGFDIDFANDAILSAGTSNQNAVAEAVQAGYRAQMLDDAAAQALIDLPTASDVADAFGGLSAEVTLDNSVAVLHSQRRFNDSLLSCANRARSAEEFSFFDDGTCGYLSIGEERFERDNDSQSTGFDADSFDLTFGGQVALNEVWHLGGAFQYSDTSLDVDGGGASSDGEVYYLGVSGKGIYGNVEIGGSLAASYGSFDNTRRPVDGGRANSSQDQWTVSGQVRATYLMTEGNRFVKPRIGLGFDHSFGNSFTETGTSEFLMSVDTSDETYFHVQPAIEFGADYALENGIRLRPQLTLALTQYIGNPSVSADARFVSAGLPGFENEVDVDATWFDIQASLDLFTVEGATLRADVNSSFSENSQSFGGGLRLEVPF
ncbi:MAG: hypothetical protein AAGG56_01955 [Pseudomonadota bacterium]